MAAPISKRKENRHTAAKIILRSLIAEHEGFNDQKDYVYALECVELRLKYEKVLALLVDSGLVCQTTIDACLHVASSNVKHGSA